MGSTSPFLLAVAGVGVGLIIVDVLRVTREIRKGSTLIRLVGMPEVGALAIAHNFLTDAGKRSMVSTFKGILPLLAKATVFQNVKRVLDFDYFNEEPGEDYISRLPDDILCHIISYLDKKDAANTFVLSRRLRRIYYILLRNPKFECHKMLEFAFLIKRNCHIKDKQRFVTAVDTFLRHRSGIPMESFTLRYGLRRGFSGDLRRWLDCIVRCGVGKLDINFCCVYDEPRWLDCIVRCGVGKLDINFCCVYDEPCRIPFSELIVFPFMVLSSASTLEYVQLSSCILELNFEGPFNSLKELKLSSVPLDNSEVEIILSCCPQLKSLKLVSCKLPSKLLVTALELRTLYIGYCGQVNQIGFSTPNLEYISYRNNYGLSFLPSSVPNLNSFFLDLSRQKQPPQDVGGFVSLAPCLSTLWIQATTHQVQDIQKEMSKLSNLDVLSLHVIKGSLDLREIVSLIAVCPNISTFELSSPHCSLSYTERDAEVPLTFVNLQFVLLDGFKFDAAQMKFASKLLRCAPTLRSMRIYTAYCFYHEGKFLEKTLPSRRRDFPFKVISRTREQLERVASSPTAVVSITHHE